MSDSINLNVIGTIDSPYKEKFAIPRQPGIVTAAQGQLRLTGSANNAELVRGLAQFSHIWLLFVFHGTQAQGWKPMVRPPRLGGNKKLGVFATRSTFRPNPIGMSVVKLGKIEQQPSQVILHISELDLLDGTPILDIKPYVPYADIIENAHGGYAQEQPNNNIKVIFSNAALVTLDNNSEHYPTLQSLIEQVLSQDPRPAYKQNKADDKIYGMTLYKFNINWQMTDSSTLHVIAIEHIDSNTV
ncbi:tRNA (N6-threonylcarbamoyladenosine(37)-N6)-methyltransferase TrmO [Cognaticolwellia beringensis]|uniref:tRNA (N6-threonylcarbamoyladenosine(37)-N6)-methyltransferase TrmO n=1 Tax=Cognaticolwellia beringensis TaxID=1967665 RepID=A0A222G5P8_9GAMM|nr:tRNA (N6-threonylcarbamoyladenosine(37)-N6)-methyltransferase TrmO [Cognaticolwellia beringensis]ASP47110.1 tRNA (N6-threonylcarbamoyladenosine(37)-N6)-methyltransferase TrmO [Cognaticolwellia beringensis]